LNIPAAQSLPTRFATKNPLTRFQVKSSKNGYSQPGTAFHPAKDRILPTLLSSVPIPLSPAILGTPLVIPYYHIVSDEQVPHVKHLYRYRNVRQFTNDLDFFLAHYESVTLDDLLQHLDEKRSLPKRCFHLTFDDGFREMHDIVAPILRAKGVPATFFLTTGFIDNVDMAHHCKFSLLVEHLAQISNSNVEVHVQQILAEGRTVRASIQSQMVSTRYAQRHLATEIARVCEYDFGQYLAARQPYLNSDQIRSLLKQGFSIGAHSVDHPLYADLSLKEQTRQTVESIRFLVKHFELDQRVFAFPHSDAGVREEFFKEMRDKRHLEVSFGTAGMRRHFFRWNLERFSMENSSLPAAQVVRMNYLRGLRWRMFA
jgi:peptidoglycan/xylan/chitin deacetylase (PgdA/CDA1 family)